MKTLATLRLFLLICLPLLGASCTISSPAKRAERRPAAFQALPPEHQKLALAGQIKEGMNRDGVWIAWGPAGRILEVSDNGVRSEVWRYGSLEPVYRSSFGIGFGVSSFHGDHFHSRFYDPFFPYTYGPDYVPVISAEVKFRNGLVRSWERISR